VPIGTNFWVNRKEFSFFDENHIVFWRIGDVVVDDQAGVVAGVLDLAIDDIVFLPSFGKTGVHRSVCDGEIANQTRKPEGSGEVGIVDPLVQTLVKKLNKIVIGLEPRGLLCCVSSVVIETEVRMNTDTTPRVILDCSTEIHSILLLEMRRENKVGMTRRFVVYPNLHNLVALWTEA
jgi:hypothetical protein